MMAAAADVHSRAIEVLALVGHITGDRKPHACVIDDLENSSGKKRNASGMPACLSSLGHCRRIEIARHLATTRRDATRRGAGRDGRVAYCSCGNER
jgi:hypothetical protein